MLVNCAGINVGNNFLEVDGDQWDKILAVNLKGTMTACQVFIEAMLKNKDGGSILNIGSVNSARPLSASLRTPKQGGRRQPYAQHRAKFGTQGIRCNAVAPASFPPNRTASCSTKARGKHHERHPDAPLRRSNELVGAAILLLAKKAGSYITAAPLYVDGGFTCNWF